MVNKKISTKQQSGGGVLISTDKHIWLLQIDKVYTDVRIGMHCWFC